MADLEEPGLQEDMLRVLAAFLRRGKFFFFQCEKIHILELMIYSYYL